MEHLFSIEALTILIALTFIEVLLVILRMRKKHGKTIQLHEAHLVADEPNINDSAK
jgi:hypothetical protein